MPKAGLICLFIFAAIINQSCKKSIASNTGTTVDFPRGGLSNFDLGEINFTSDTTVVLFQVELSPASISEDVTISAAVDDAERVAYNSTSTSLTYAALPDSCYSFSAPAVQIVSGSETGFFSITFYKSKINLAQSFMLPITITSAEGLAINDTMKTLYFHINGNFLTNNLYNDVGTKTEYSGPNNTDSIDDVITCPSEKYFFATGLNSVAIDYADLGTAGWQYLVTANPTNGTVTVQPNNIIIVETGGVLDSSFGIDLQTYDPATNTFHFVTHYINDAGKLRIVDETLTKQ